MITRPSDFTALQRDGSSRAMPLLAVRFRRTDLPTTRFGFATGKKLGGAVVRNRVRRRIRESLRALSSRLVPGWDILVIARQPIVGASQAEIAAALAALLGRSGLLAPEAGA
jgi:ribonuclease P protein component